MYICIDFDGTIVDHTFPEVGKPVPGAVEWMKTWQKSGAKLILFTMRGNQWDGGRNFLHEAVNYLSANDLQFFGINRNPTQDDWTKSPKAYGQVYVDDAAFGCPMTDVAGFNRRCVDWSIVGPEIHKMLLKRK